MAFKDRKTAEQKKKKRDGVIGTIVTFLVLLPLLAMMLPTVVFLFLAMLPTFVALVLDRKGREKYKWMCVGGTNFAGALYYLFELLVGDASVPTALFIFFRIDSMLVIYGAAAFGYCLYKIVPLFVINFQSLANQHRLSFLRNSQKNLIEQWGAEVSDGVPPSK